MQNFLLTLPSDISCRRHRDGSLKGDDSRVLARQKAGISRPSRGWRR